jgi:transposase
MKTRIPEVPKKTFTIGLDLGDKSSAYCVLDAEGTVISEQKVRTTPKALSDCFGAMAIGRIALETGTHSPWVSRLLSAIGHEVIVANARHVRLIAQSRQKDDRLDARTLARLARVDPKLLSPVTHRSAQAQADLSLIRARAGLVRSRATLINMARGLVKTNGERLQGSSSRIIKSDVSLDLSPALRVSVEPVLASIKALTVQIREYNRKIIELGKTSYPEVALLTQVHGVGPLVALTYILTLEDPHRFEKSRDAGCYIGLQPARRNSGTCQPQLHITKQGDPYLRSLLIESAHHILGPFGTDSDLRRWGLTLASRGAALGKKRALVGVARKLAVVLHHLWVTGEVYQPLHQASATATQTA